MELGINSIPSVQPNEVENLIEEGCVLVDVRENDEWTSGHHVGAIHIPMGEIIENINNFNQNEKYIFVCRSGSRSARVCLLYTSPSPRDLRKSRMPSSA